MRTRFAKASVQTVHSRFTCARCETGGTVLGLSAKWLRFEDKGGMVKLCTKCAELRSKQDAFNETLVDP